MSKITDWTLDHEHVPVKTDDAPNHPALSLTLCGICFETLEYEVHKGRDEDRQEGGKVRIFNDEREAVLV